VLTLNPSPKRISVLIVESHAVVRVGLRTILSQNPRLEIVGEVGTGAAARAETVRLHPQVVLMDLRLPDRTGIEVCRDILDEIPTTRVLFLTSFRDDDSMLAAVLAGASGYLLKEIGPERLSQAVEMVAEGHAILDQKAMKIIQSLAAQVPGTPPFSNLNLALSQQQYRVVQLVAKGMTNKEIAKALGLSEKTVRNYLSTIFEKLHITRRSQAAAMYSQNYPWAAPE